MNWIGWIRAGLGTLPRALVRRELRQFTAAARDCRGTQAAVLDQILALNADAEFSRQRGLSPGIGVREFQRRLPVSGYDEYRPAIEQLKVGRTAALLGSGNPLLMFTLSSGTTADAKYIPITRRFLADYRRGWHVWGIRALDAHPAINRGHILQLTSDYDQFRTPGGTPCGNISGLVAAMQKRIVRSMYTVPGAVSKITDPDARHLTVLRLALADRDVAMVSTANPSTLLRLADLSARNAAALIRDVADGTLSAVEPAALPDEVRGRLARRINRPDRRRAGELQRTLDVTGRLDPKDVWPQLTLAAVWTGGSAAAYLPRLRELYGNVPVRDHGLSASEGRMTIPLADGTPDGVLDVGTHFFEFIPEAEYGSAAGPRGATVLQAHELQADRNYYILLSTASGLYRYDICDVIRCTGHFGTTPVLRFLHKGAHIASLTGEKISESQVVAALGAAAAGLSIRLPQFTLCPVWGEPPGYALLIETPDATEDQAALLAAAADAHLSRLNCEYREKRATGRLTAIAARRMPPGTWSRVQQRKLNRPGGSAEQYKHPCLVPDLEFYRSLSGRNGRSI
jgi:hypothetical protein